MCHNIHPFKVYKTVVYSVFTNLCNHHHHLIPEHFHDPKKKIHSPWHSLSTSPYPQPLATTNPFSVCIDLPILDILHKWNKAICSVLCLSSFI